jgi:predicted outer membrane repeat protein
MQMRYLLILVFLELLFISCRKNDSLNGDGIIIGDTYTGIEGNISGRLAYDSGPFLVKNDIYVQTSDTLLIDAGVYIYFESGRRFIVEGVLIAKGVIQKPIVFRTYDENSWSGISITNSPKLCEFSYCIIQQVYQERDDAVTNGAVEIQNSNVAFQNCIFRNNSSLMGGGIYSDNATLNISNCIFTNNDAETFGGAMLLENTFSTIINNTFYNNFCTNFGGGIVLNNPALTEIQNNIFYKSLSVYPDPHIALVYGDSANIFEQYNFLPDDSMDPLFKSNNDLHLGTGSPCINKGNPDSVFNDTDGTRNDQGAYGGPNGDW